MASTPLQPRDSDERPLPGAFSRPHGFHVMIKPVGPVCNLACSYCFYLHKGKYYPESKDFRMSLEVLESFTRQYIEAQEVPEVTFGWQGGEPTLSGLDFFRKAVELQRKYRPRGMRILNAFQTNGILVDDDWCRFFKENHFLVGLSLDGPQELHDRYRRDKSGHPTFGRVMDGLERLRKHSVEYNVLCVVHRHNSRKPLDVYGFFKREGVHFLQFIPLVEKLAPPGNCIREARVGRDISEATVVPGDYGRFLTTIYDEWIRKDVGNIYVQPFEAAFASYFQGVGGICVFEPTCGRAMALEHNGDLYSCDHFVYPENKLGNILTKPLAELARKPFQLEFGADKRDRLPRACRVCPVARLCRGECPKNRFIHTAEGQPELNYLCPGLKMFFRHALPTLDWMAKALRSGRAPAEIMDALARSSSGPAPPLPREKRGEQPGKTVGRNDPCPCGSGAKFKRCCGK